MGLKRHSTRVFGLAKNTILLGLIVAVTNMNVLRNRYGYDAATPEGIPPTNAIMRPIPKPASQATKANHRFRVTPPPEGGPPPPTPGEQPWTNLN